MRLPWWSARDLRLDLAQPLPPGDIQVIILLQIHPELWRVPEILGQAKGGISRNPSLIFQDR